MRHAITLSALALATLAGTAHAQITDRVSIGLAGTAAAGASSGVQVTPDGRFAVFMSHATNMVTADANTAMDVFIRDRYLNTTTLISAPDPSTGESLGFGGDSTITLGGSRVISDNGRFVAFMSDASNLVIGDTNGVTDCFIRDRDLDRNGVFDEPGIGKTRTIRVSVSSAENQSVGNCPNGICDHGSFNPVISADGRYVAFDSWHDFTSDSVPYGNIYWRDRDADNDGFFDEVGGSPDAAVTRLVSGRIQQSVEGTQGDGTSWGAAISADGMTVTFTSTSRYMVFGDSTSNSEIFARNMATNAIVRITEPLFGGQPNGHSTSSSISADGRYVAFASFATNLTGDIDTSIENVLIKDRDTDNDGVFDEVGSVAYSSASKGYNPFILGNPIVNLNNSSNSPYISDDGSKVAFKSLASNVFCSVLNGCTDTNGVADIFVFDSSLGRAERVSLSANNTQATEASLAPAMSGNGRFVAFVSAQHTLDGAGFNPGEEVYVRALESRGNDSCDTAIPVNAGTITAWDNWGPFDANGIACGPTSNSAVWFTHTAACTGSITVDTNGSSFDTLLSVYNGSCPFDAAELVGCDDDSGNGLASSITFDAVEGQTYAIRVGGFGNAAGLVFLGVSQCTPACPADYNLDGGVDGDDVIAFFSDWDSSNIAADFNNDGGVDGDDVIQFFEHWDAGC